MAPTDITITENEDGDLIISSSDLDYLQALSNSESVLYDDVEAKLSIHNTNSAFEYDGTNVTISNSIILNNRIGNGTYSVYFYNVDGYTNSIHLTVTITKGAKEAPTDITITENEDGDLIISSSDEGFLEALGNNGFRLGFDFFGFVEKNDYEYDGTNVIISHSMILRNRVSNGTYSVNIYKVFGYVNSDLITVTITKGAKEAPTDITITENEDGDLIISSSDKDYLQAIVDSECYINGLISNNNEFVFDGDNVIIDNEYILSYGIANNEYELAICNVYGYTDSDVITFTITKGAKAAPTDITITENEDGDLIISSSDADYLQAIANSECYINGLISNNNEFVFDGDNVIIDNEYILSYGIANNEYELAICNVYGYIDSDVITFTITHGCIQAPTDITITENEDGDLIISSSDKDYLQALANSEACLSGDNLFIENYYWDFEYDGTNVIIKNSMVLKKNIGNGTYSVNIKSVHGFNPSEDITVTITKGAKEAPTDITITENEDGDLIISSSDKDYLQALANSEVYLSGDNLFIKNYNGNFEYDGNNVIIKNYLILKNNIGNGTYSLDINYVFGYTDTSDITVTITHGYKEAPTDITITENEDGDLIISSSDKDYLKKVALSAFRLDGSISIRCNKSVEFDGENIVFDNSNIVFNNIVNGTYSVYIDEVYGYYSSETLSLTITHGCKETPDDITITENEDGDLVISSNDKDYLKALSKYGSFIYGDLNIFNDFCFEYDGTNVIIRNSTILENFIDNDAYNVYIVGVDGYANSDSIFVKITYGCKGTPTDITITQNEDGDLIVSSSDKDYLQAMFNSKCIIEGNLYLPCYDYFEYDGECIIIDKSLIKKYKIKNGNYNVQIKDVIGYYSKTDIPVTISNGCKQAPKDITITENKNGDLIISSSDLEYLNEVARRSYIYGDLNIRNFPVYEDINNPNNNLELKDNYIVIDNSIIINGRYANGTYGVSITEVYGWLDSEIITITITKGAKEAPTDITITENDDGDLIISSSDKDYLQAIANSASKLCYFEITNDDQIFEYDGINIVIDNAVIKAKKIINGTYYNVYFTKVNGYADSGMITVKITHGFTYKKAPTDINITQNDDGDLIISSSDTEYLYSLFNDEWELYIRDYFSACVTKDYMVFDGTNVIVDSSIIMQYFKLKGVYNACIYVSGYKPSKDFLLFVKGQKFDPIDVTISENDDGDLIVSSSDKNYLQALANTKNAYVEFMIEERRVYNDGTFVFDGTSTIIPNAALKDQNIANGKLSLHIGGIDGYSGGYTIDVELTHQFEKENSFEIINSCIGWIISSKYDNTYHLEKMIQNEDSFIIIADKPSREIINVIGNNGKKFKYENGKLLIPIDLIENSCLNEGNYWIVLGVDGEKYFLNYEYDTVKYFDIIHDYQFYDITWDGYEAKANYTCSHDSNHKESYDCTVTKTYILPTNDTDDVTIKYTARYDDHESVKNGYIKHIIMSSKGSDNVSIDSTVDITISIGNTNLASGGIELSSSDSIEIVGCKFNISNEIAFFDEKRLQGAFISKYSGNYSGNYATITIKGKSMDADGWLKAIVMTKNAATDTGYSEIKVDVKVVCKVHDNSVTDSKDATCTTDGYIKYKCSVCNLETTTPIYALSHDYQYTKIEWDGFTAKAVYTCSHDNTHVQKINCAITSAVTTASTCVSKGTKTYTATYDKHSDTKDEELNKLDHTFGSFNSKVPATCTQPGTKGYYYCSACKKNYDINEVEITDLTIPALKHDYQFVDITWTDYTAKANYVCSHDTKHTQSYDCNVTNAETTKPTCTDTGVRTYTATYDKYSDTKTQNIDALQHDYQYTKMEWTNYTAKAVYTCSHDNTHVQKYNATVTNAVTKNASCVQKGVRTYTATYDKYSDTKTQDIAMLAHDLAHTNRKEATRATDGNIEYWYCSSCKNYYSNANASKKISKEETIIHKESIVVSSISMKSNPTKEEYIQDEVLDVTGGEITLKLSNGLEENVNLTNDMVTNFDSSEASDNKEVIVTYGGKYTSFNIKIGPKYKLGDVNNDDIISDADAIHLLMHTFFPEEYQVNQPCDFNNDGEINDADAIHLLMYTFFPEEYPLSK